MNETQVGYPIPDIHPPRHQSLMQRTPGMNGADMVLANNVSQATGNLLVPADTGPIRQYPLIHMQVFAKNWMWIMTVYFVGILARFLNDHQAAPWIESAVDFVKPSSTSSKDGRKNLAEQELLWMGLGNHECIFVAYSDGMDGIRLRLGLVLAVTLLVAWMPR
jgi:hypothetical protein